jgi:flagellar basal-body rod protein FlgG
MMSTGNNLDVAVSGRGWFQVTMPSGATAYTRAGSFQIGPQGTLVTPQGYTVVPGITIPNDALSVTVNNSGEVLVQLPGQVTASNVGQLQLATFANESGLQAMGDNLFKDTAASGNPITGVPGSTGFGTLQQGFLETSNVNMVNEITSMISAQRAYELASKVVTTSDEMMTSLTRA